MNIERGDRTLFQRSLRKWGEGTGSLIFTAGERRIKQKQLLRGLIKGARAEAAPASVGVAFGSQAWGKRAKKQKRKIRESCGMIYLVGLVFWR